MSTSPFLPTNLVYTTAQNVQEAVNKLRDGIAQFNRAFSVMDTARSTTGGADDTVFETGNSFSINLIGVSAGRGDDWFAACNSLHTGINDSDVLSNLSKIDQGSSS